jgi:hypothetical protein
VFGLLLIILGCSRAAGLIDRLCRWYVCIGILHWRTILEVSVSTQARYYIFETNNYNFSQALVFILFLYITGTSAGAGAFISLGRFRG